ncbi:hypothetical protein PAMP_024625 [Pampus punctatissimus]
MSNTVWVSFVRVTGVYNFINLSSDVSSPSLYIGLIPQLHQEGVATKSLSSHASGVGREKIIITIIHNKIFALRPTPLQSEASQTQAHVVAEPNFIEDLVTGIVVELRGPSTE